MIHQGLRTSDHFIKLVDRVVGFRFIMNSGHDRKVMPYFTDLPSPHNI